jgi:hypothetical protein
MIHEFMMMIRYLDLDVDADRHGIYVYLLGKPWLCIPCFIFEKPRQALAF